MTALHSEAEGRPLGGCVVARRLSSAALAAAMLCLGTEALCGVEVQNG